MNTLRQQVLGGAVALAGRHGLGMIVSAVGVLLLTQMIGPANYGLFVSAIGLLTFVNFVAPLGVDVYLLRTDHLEEDDYHRAFTLLLAGSVVVALVAGIAVMLIGERAGAVEFVPLAVALLCGLPLGVTTRAATAHLERALNYRAIAATELGGVVIFQVSSLLAAAAGMQAWSAVVGWWLQQLVMAAGVHVISGYRPRLRWNTTAAVRIWRDGFGYTGSLAIWQLRTLINPLLLLPLLGPVAVGYVGLAMRLVELLSMVKTATWRLGIAAFARLQGDLHRSRAAVSEGMRLQALGVGAPLAAFALVAPIVMPRLFQERWREWAPVLDLFPYLGLAGLCNALFSLHSSLLYTRGRNGAIALFHAAHVAVLFAALAWLVPRFGLAGVAAAEIVALTAYAMVHVSVVREVGAPDYSVAAVWAIAAGMVLLAPRHGWGWLLGLVGALAWPATWRAADAYRRLLWSPKEVSHA